MPVEGWEAPIAPGPVDERASMNDSEAPRGLTGVVMSGVGLAGGGHVLGQLINLAIYVVLARLATPEDFGVLAAGGVVVMAGSLLAGSGMSAAVIQRRDRLEEAASTAVVSTVVGGILLTLGALARSLR